MARKLAVDKWLFLTTLGLTLFGVVMVYSASALRASFEEKGMGVHYSYALKQGVWVILGLAAMWVVMRYDYRRLCRGQVVLPLLLVTAIALVSVFLFGRVNGARRWIRLGSFLSVQPSEFAKLTLALYLAYYLDKRKELGNAFLEVFAPCLFVTACLAGLVALEPDLGTALMLVLMCAVMCFTAGMKLWQMALGLVPAVAAGAAMLILSPWRWQRLMAFLDPWSDTQARGNYHVIQSLVAIGSGGWHGVGFGESKQKLYFLPYPYADSIFAVIGEELGLVGCATILVLFVFFLWRGLRAAMNAPDRFGLLLGVGLTVNIFAQALFNMGVALSLLPNKGIPLPFISAGGSSLLPTLMSVGLLLSISQYAGAPDTREDEARKWTKQPKEKIKQRITGKKGWALRRV